MPSKRSPSKSRSTSKARGRAKAPAKSRSPTKKASAKKTPQKQSAAKSRSRSASRKANTAPAAGASAQRRAAAAAAPTTPVARPSRSRSRTRAEPHKSAQRFTVTTTTVSAGRPTSTAALFEDQLRPRRGVATYGTGAADVSARTARYVAKSAQNAPWRVCQWLSAAKQSAAQKWRRSCLHRPSVAKARRHFAHNVKWYVALFAFLLLAGLAYKFQRELLVQMREVQTQLADFVETQRNIFG